MINYLINNNLFFLKKCLNMTETKIYLHFQMIANLRTFCTAKSNFNFQVYVMNSQNLLK